MKLNNQSANWRSAAVEKFAVTLLFLSLTLIVLAPAVRATIPEPDNLLYGAVVLDNQPVTAARTDVIVEARRTLEGSPLSSYRMGSDARAGDFYSLRVALESIPPAVSPVASQMGDTLFIVVRDASGVRAQTAYTIQERGAVLRLDFGAAPSSPDSGGNGLPGAWEIAHFGATGQDPHAINLNGRTTYENFITGADPNDPDSAFLLTITHSEDQQIVSFLARRAEGPGYEGATRLYSVEFSPDPAGSTWEGMTGFVNLPGNNQTVVFSVADAGAAVFLRGRVVLQTVLD
jgi:hypothetical protein